MKKIVVLLMFLVFSVPIFASSIVYNSTITTSTGIATDENFILDLSIINSNSNYFPSLSLSNPIDYLSVQANFSTETANTAISFTDGVCASGKITVLTKDGIAGSTVTVNGLKFIEGRDWTETDKSSSTATSIYNILTTSITYIRWSNPLGGTVIYGTSTVVDTVGDYSFSSSVTSITVVSMVGGASTYFDYPGNNINQTNTFLTGLPVLFTVTAGTSPTNLVGNTTYYAIPTATSLQLATSKVNAISMTAIDISSQTYPGNGNFTLTPLALSDSSPFTLNCQCSNDKVNWYNLGKSTTVVSTTTPTTILWDFGYTDYRYWRLQEISGSGGSIKLGLIGFGKKVSP